MNGQPVWERQADSEGQREPARWFARFERYLAAGPRRSLLGLYNAEREKARKGATKSIPGAWRKASEQWQWRSRAEAWDAHLAEQARVEREARERQLREEAQLTRRNLLGVGHNLLAKAMLLYMGQDGARPDAQTVQRLVGAIVKFNEDSRAEYGALPVQPVDVTSGGQQLSQPAMGYFGLAGLADLAELDDEELDARITRLRHLQERLAATEPGVGPAADPAGDAPGAAPAPAGPAGQSGGHADP